MSENLIINKDGRGNLIEIFKFSEPQIGQIFFSTSKPGVIRGNHYHARHLEKFCVIEGLGKIKLRNRETGETKEYNVSGDNPEIVDMFITWTHNIKNIGEGEMKLIAWSSEVFNPNDPDTFPEEV
jgi:UDP-2-acetamido-2,6-beta-L-arabino-hexul-4-ose reductase